MVPAPAEREGSPHRARLSQSEVAVSDVNHRSLTEEQHRILDSIHTPPSLVQRVQESIALVPWGLTRASIYIAGFAFTEQPLFLAVLGGEALYQSYKRVREYFF